MDKTETRKTQLGDFPKTTFFFFFEEIAGLKKKKETFVGLCSLLLPLFPLGNPGKC